jgi:dephospho-CoA kinase
MILIGLTGGIAVGKSTVSSVLQNDFGLHVIDCDAIVHALQQPKSGAVRQIAKLWPQCVTSDGVLLRDRLGEIVFRDPSARRKLASIMNWRIFMSVMCCIFQEWWRTVQDRGCGVVVLDAPILFESKTFLSYVSNVLVVSCDEGQQRERLIKRNGLNEEAASQRIAAQMPLAEKRQRAGYVLHNNVDISSDELPNVALRERVADAVAWMATQRPVRYPEWSCGCLAVGLLAVVGAAVQCCCR